MATVTRAAFLFDAPDLEGFAFPDGVPEDIPADVEKPTSRIQVAKLGTFKHPRYGKFTITRATFDSFIANLAVVLAGGEAPIDFDHEPDLGGKSAACGWIKKLTIDGDVLLADVEWTWDGAYAIREGVYKYFSPTWVMNFLDDEGVAHGPTLIGGGLTNRPFFNRMAVVNCSQSFSRDEQQPATEEEPEAAPEASDSRRAMSTFATIAKQLGLTEDASEETVLTAARELQARAAKAPAENEALTAARAEIDALKASVTSAKETADSAVAALAETRLASAIETAKQAGRAVPEDLEATVRNFFKHDQDAALAMLEQLPVTVQIAARGDAGNGGATEAPDGVDPERYALDQKVQTYMREHDGVTYDVALTRVMAEEATA